MSRRSRILLFATGGLVIFVIVGLQLLKNQSPQNPNSANQTALNQEKTETTRLPVPTLAVVDLPPVGLGQPSTKDGLSVTILGITFQKALGDITPNTGNIYLVADVQLENTGVDSFAFSNLNFGVTDAAGHTYQPAHGSFDYAPAPALKPGQLAKGDHVGGNVVIEIPASLSTGMVSYQNEQANVEIWYRYQFTWK